MGVKSLWSLLTPVGRPVLLETMEGKSMAIDSSIWIYQFQATMRDKDGRVLVNAHVLGFLRRICKLLFYGIKPVFVFDGGAPALKRMTISGRKKKKSGAAETHAKLAERLLAAQLRREALNHANNSATMNDRGKKKVPEGPVVIDNDAVFLEDIDGSIPKTPAKKKGKGKEASTPSSSSKNKSRFHDHDPYRLPEVNMEAAIAKATRSSAPDPRLATEDELRDFIEQMRPEDLDVTSPAFRELPTEVQYEIIGDLRLKSRQTSHKRLQTMLRSAPTPIDFSRAQIRNLQQRNALTQQLLTTTDSIGKANISIPVRIASERNREYVLVKNEGEGGGWVLGIRDEGTQAKPIQVDAADDDHVDEESESDIDMEEVTIPMASEHDADLREYQRELALGGLAGRQPNKRVTSKRSLTQSPTDFSRKPSMIPLFVPDDEDDDDLAPQLLKDDNDDQVTSAIEASLEQQEADDIRRAIEASKNPKTPVKTQQPNEQAENQRTLLGPLSDSDDDLYAPIPSRLDTALAFADTGLLSATRHQQSSGSSNRSVIFNKPLLLISPDGSPTKNHTVPPFMPADLSSESDEDMEEVVVAATPLTSSKAARTPPQELGDISRENRGHPSDAYVKDTYDGTDSLMSTGLLAQRSLPTIPLLSTSDLSTPGSKYSNQSPVTVFQPTDERDEQSHIADISLDLSKNASIKDMLSTGRSLETSESPRKRPEKEIEDVDNKFVKDGLQYATVQEPEESSSYSIRRSAPVSESTDSPRAELSMSPESGHVHHRSPLLPINQDLIQEDNHRSDQSRSQSPDADPSSPRPGPEDVADWDAAEEMDIQEEEGEFARFVSHVKGRDLASVRREIDEEIRTLNQQKKAAMRDSEDITQQMISQIMAMLRLFGIPYITAPMEAEAQCAELVSLGLVDGIITDDSDVFLFGGLRVFKNMFNQSKTVECFLLGDLAREVGLDRDKLIRLAYLLGSDYVEGLPGVGPVVAMEILNEFSGEDGLHKFKDWWLKVQSGRDGEMDNISSFRKRFKKRFKDLYLSQEWPNPAVRDAYYHPAVDTSEEPFKWGLPDLDALRDFFRDELSWNSIKVDELLLPIIQKMGKRGQNNALNKQGILNEFFEVHAGGGTYEPRKRQAYTSKRLQQLVSDHRKEQAKLKRNDPSGSSSDSGSDDEESEPVPKKRKTARSNKPEGGSGLPAKRGRGKERPGRGRGRGGRGVKAVVKVSKKRGASSSSVEDEYRGEDDLEIDKIVMEEPPPLAVKLRPRPKPAYRGADQAPEENPNEPSENLEE